MLSAIGSTAQLHRAPGAGMLLRSPFPIPHSPPMTFR
ncbi:esterase, partial [Xanthomonas perforans]